MNFDQPYPRLPLRADRSVQGDHSVATGAWDSAEVDYARLAAQPNGKPTL
jgi:hypothetical protein